MTTKRDAVLEATLELISEHGFHGTAMSMIADRAGVGAGTIYRYFDSKEDLVTQLYLEVKREMGKAILADYSEELSLRERFRTLWLNMLHYYMEHACELAFLEQFDNSPYMVPEVREAFSEYYEPLMRYFQYAFREGVFKKMPLAMLSTFTLEVAVSLAKHHAAGELTLDDETKELAMNATWDALSR
ncbi:MAG: TetR/AcrR family transcriptional regulator [Anaerolineae bacterium]|jgi:AcrR family transcriptional regulator